MIAFQTIARDQMLEHARRQFPDECCGFLLGTEDPEGNRSILEITEVHNAREGDKRRRFEISPKDYLHAEQQAIEKDLQLLGIYHSHPNHPAIPSEHDRISAQPYFSYIIISVMLGKIDHTRSWRLGEDARFSEEHISSVHGHQSI